MRRDRLLVVGAATLALSGCGAETSPGAGPLAGIAPTTGPQVCELVDAATASAIVGATVAAQPGPLDTCEYRPSDEAGTSFTLGVVAGSSIEPADYLDGLSASLEVEEEIVPDLGEAARLVSGTATGFGSTAGAAVAGDVIYTVDVTPATGLDASAELALAEELLRALLSAVGHG